MAQAVGIIRKIGGLTFDATFSEKHEIEAEITENPVETGVSVADHMFMKPLRVTISAGVSDVVLTKASNDPYGGGSSRSKAAFDLLTQLQATFEPFSVQTGLRLYQNMVCKTITCIQDKDTSSAFVFEAELRGVIMVTTQSVTMPPRAAGATTRQAGSTVNNGTVQPTQVTDPTKQQEIEDQITGSTVINLLAGGIGGIG